MTWQKYKLNLRNSHLLEEFFQSWTRLFHLRLRCILNESGIFIVKTMGVWLVYFVDFQQNKCLKN